MNSFSSHLEQSLSNKIKIEVDVFVSKKKKLVHLSLFKPLLSYEFFKEIIDYIRCYWNDRKKNFPEHFLICSKLNQTLKWHFDYIIIVKNKTRSKKNRRAIR